MLIKESGAQVAYLHVDSGAAIGRAGRALPAFDSLVEVTVTPKGSIGFTGTYEIFEVCDCQVTVTPTGVFDLI